MASIKGLNQLSIFKFCDLDMNLTRDILTKMASLDDFLMKKISASQVESTNSVKKSLAAALTQGR